MVEARQPRDIQDLTANDNDGTVSGAPNMVTIPEGTTEGLSTLGSLTQTRLGSGAFCIPPQGSVVGKLGGHIETPQVPFGTQNWTIACWMKPAAYTDGYQCLWWYTPDNGYGTRALLVASGGTVQMDAQGDGTTATCSVVEADIFSDWSLVVYQRLAAASFKGWIRMIGDSSWATVTNTNDPGNMTEADVENCGFGLRVENDAYNLNGPIAFPRIWLHGSDTPWVEAELNAIFEQGKRFLLGDS